MSTIYFDSTMSEPDRREHLYQGHLFCFSLNKYSAALCEFAREMIEEAFFPYDPQFAQNYYPVEKYVEILTNFKPRFIHHPTCKHLIQKLLENTGYDPEKTYFDVPRLRTSTANNYLTSGIAYAFHPHRDTWYSASQSQINWWLPIYEIAANNAMAFHPGYWNKPIKNSSADYNYDEWVKTNRSSAAQHIYSDTREQPTAEEFIELEPQIRLITKPGGMILFSAAQLHSSVPNTSHKTRFSVDFRIVNFDDIKSFKGAPNIDSACIGTALKDFLCCSDLTNLPAEILNQYNNRKSYSIS